MAGFSAFFSLTPLIKHERAAAREIKTTTRTKGRTTHLARPRSRREPKAGSLCLSDMLLLPACEPALGSFQCCRWSLDQPLQDRNRAASQLGQGWAWASSANPRASGGPSMPKVSRSSRAQPLRPLLTARSAARKRSGLPAVAPLLACVIDVQAGGCRVRAAIGPNQSLFCSCPCCCPCCAVH